MYCSNCGKELENEARYCSICGTARAPFQPPSGSPQPPLSRVRQGRKIAGVCGGVARYFDLDPTLVRIIWIVAAVCPPLPGFIAYLVCWIAMPQDPLPYKAPPNSASTTSQTVDA